MLNYGLPKNSNKDEFTVEYLPTGMVYDTRTSPKSNQKLVFINNHGCETCETTMFDVLEFLEDTGFAFENYKPLQAEDGVAYHSIKGSRCHHPPSAAVAVNNARYYHTYTAFPPQVVLVVPMIRYVQRNSIFRFAHEFEMNMFKIRFGVY